MVNLMQGGRNTLMKTRGYKKICNLYYVYDNKGKKSNCKGGSMWDKNYFFHVKSITNKMKTLDNIFNTKTTKYHYYSKNKYVCRLMKLSLEERKYFLESKT